MPKGTEDQVGFFDPQSKHTWNISNRLDFGYSSVVILRTLFAGFSFSFSNIFCDSDLSANAICVVVWLFFTENAIVLVPGGGRVNTQSS